MRLSDEALAIVGEAALSRSRDAPEPLSGPLSMLRAAVLQAVCITGVRTEAELLELVSEEVTEMVSGGLLASRPSGDADRDRDMDTDPLEATGAGQAALAAWAGDRQRGRAR